MLAELAVTEPFTFQSLTEHSKSLVSWKNRNSTRMTMEDFDEIKKGELPPEWNPKNFQSQIPGMLQQRIKEQFTNVCSPFCLKTKLFLSLTLLGIKKSR
jgi:hypothetical protein